MSISKLSTGDGYAYYTAMTASGDDRRADGQELGDYYLETGMPEGRWMGAGCEALGVAGVVKEAQMKALMGEGRHPNADAIEQEILSSGGTVSDAERATRLGRRPARFKTPSGDLAAAIEKAKRAREARIGRELTVDELRRIRMKEAAKTYQERFGHGATDNKELAAFLAKELKQGANAVAAYDLTFSPPKSVSVLWAVSDKETSRAIEAAHEAAITETISYIEKHAIGTRTGPQGVAQIDTNGLVATAFRHYESRDGDPQLHDHVVVANRVQGSDGKWRTIDGAALYRNVVNASEHYNRTLAANVAKLGYALETRAMGEGKRPVVEIAGVPQELLNAHSSRSQQIRTKTQNLLEDYRKKHGREPDQKTLYKLRQQATLETRAPKTGHRTLHEMREQWKKQAVQVVGESTLTGMVETARKQGEKARLAAEQVRDNLDIIKAGEQVLQEISMRRSTWAERDIRAEVERWCARNDGWLLSSFQREAVVQFARDVLSTNLTPASSAPAIPGLVRASGESIYEQRDRYIYSSESVLNAEYRLLDAAREQAIPAASGQIFDEVLAKQTMPLDAGQVNLARHFACSERVLAVGIGPAGTGKTTAMKLAVETVQASGGRVIGLTVSATAAAQLAESTGAQSTTLAQWIFQRDNYAEGVEVRREFHLHPGDVIIVDEAGMAGTLTLDKVVKDASKAGALVRLIGDDRQLQAVESGGALRMIASEVEAAQLTEVHRFADAEEAQASLALRNGDLSWYESAGRISSGRYENIIENLVEAWDKDDSAGRESLMLADSNKGVTELNLRAQEARIARGQVQLDKGTVTLRGGCIAGVGDVIVTRRVDRSLTIPGTRSFVANGDIWRVKKANKDGSALVVRKDGREMTLPKEYLAESSELGYASTAHRAQGATVDTARMLVSTATSRESLYVGMTRGRHSNEIFVATDDQPKAVILSAITNTTRRDLAARDAMLDEAKRVDDVPTLARQHQDITRRADEIRYAALIRETYGNQAERILTSPALSAVQAAMAKAEEKGYNLERVLNRHETVLNGQAGIDKDPGRLLAWRIRDDLAKGQVQARSKLRRPLKDLSPARLEELSATAAKHRREAFEAVRLQQARRSFDARAIYTKDRVISPWSDRPHGNLLRRDLAERTSFIRGLVAEKEAHVSEARKHLAALEREWKLARLRGTSAKQPKTWRLAEEIEQARSTVSEIEQQARSNRIELGELTRELRNRRAMSKRDYCLEETQRQAHQQRGESNQEYVRHRAANILALEQAEASLQRAEVIDGMIQAEVKYRAVEPDQAVKPAVDDIPLWLIPERGMSDPRMPESWRAPLAKRREMLRDRLRRDGAAIALERPAWSRELGPLPKPGTKERAEWEARAAQVNAWREINSFTLPHRALPTESEVREQQRESLREVHRLLAPTRTQDPVRARAASARMEESLKRLKQQRESRGEVPVREPDRPVRPGVQQSADQYRPRGPRL
ncbi:MobF family relaxase [Dermabacteraceae bacterium P13147]